MDRWYRVFGTSEVVPAPGELAEEAERLMGPLTQCKFRGDDQGWFQGELLLPDEDVPLLVERYLASEEGIRHELNTWAAWLETVADNPHSSRLMQHMIGTRQVFTLEQKDAQDPLVGKGCVGLCRFLARGTDGVYQVDGEGFYGADGSLLVRESS